MKRTALLLMALLGTTGTAVQAQTLVMITGEWPPYTGLMEPQGGSITAVVKQAVEAMGDEVKVGFFPWNRVRRMVRLNQSYVAKFPDYYSADRAEDCYFSNPVGESPLGFAERRGQPINWETTADLARYRIGVVSTYVNTPEFDELATSGKIETVPAYDDEQNLLNLMAGKVDAVVIDRNVFAYLMQERESLQFARLQLQLNPKVLIVHRLYVCFQKTEQGRELRDRFNLGLKSLQAPGP